MADTDKGTRPIPTAVYRKRRDRYQASLEAIRLHLQQQLDGEDLSTWNPRKIQEHIKKIDNCTAIIKSDNEYLTLVEEDEDSIVADEQAHSYLTTLSDDTSILAKELSDLQQATLMTNEIDELLTDTGRALEEDPEIDSQSIAPINDLMKRFKDHMRCSCIGKEHKLWTTSRELSNRLTKIHKRKPTATSTDSKEFSKDTSIEDTFKVNKIHIPKFSGGLENWQSYWGRFKTAVHDNPKMNLEVKMVHLLESITDPTLTPYLTACNDGEGRPTSGGVPERTIRPTKRTPSNLQQDHCRPPAHQRHPG